MIVSERIAGPMSQVSLLVEWLNISPVTGSCSRPGLLLDIDGARVVNVKMRLSWEDRTYPKELSQPAGKDLTAAFQAGKCHVATRHIRSCSSAKPRC